MQTLPAQYTQNPKFMEILDDLCLRFILNVPEEDLESVERLFFNIEEAYWFFEDNYCKQAKKEGYFLPELSFLEFADAIISHCPLLEHLRDQVVAYTKKFQNYKFKIPAFGAILLNQSLDKMVLIKGFNCNSWSFPKGKINKHETEAQCAIREVKEEVGFDISSYLDEKNVLTKTHFGQTTKLYLIPGVPDSSSFATQVRNEVEQIRWHRLDMLNSQSSPRKSNLVQLFLSDITAWAKDKKTVRTPAISVNQRAVNAPQQRKRSPTSPEKQSAGRKQNKPKTSPPRIIKRPKASKCYAEVPSQSFGFNVEEVVKA